MAAFQFPDPTVQTTVKNPITGSTYQWQDPPGKWVVTVSIREVGDIIWEGDNPPDPIGDYKLWYSTDTLELYFYFCDANGTCAWLPTSKPITMLEDLDKAVTEIKADVVAANVAINENANSIASIVNFGETAPTIYADDVYTDFLTGEVTTEPSALNYKFWLNTIDNTLSILRVNGEAPNGYSYAEVSSNPDLQEVLTNGNVANKGFVLTNLLDDAILVSPEDARIMVGGIGEDVVPRLELRHETGIMDTSIVKLELDEDGKRFDIECDEKVDNIHFRFNDDVKFEINKTGDAVFSGKIKVQPGTEDNEAATFGQLATVAEEIEQLAPSYERGEYNFSKTEVTGSSSTRGTYNLIRKNNSSDSADDRQACEDAFNLCQRIPDADVIDCQRDYNRCLDDIPGNGTVDVYIDKFTEIQQIKFSKYDVKGAKHEWNDVVVGQIIDIFNEDNEDYFVGTITAIDNGTSVVTLNVNKEQAKGTATGKARIKVFTLNNEIDDLGNYVRKTGDKMSGKLETTDRIWVRPDNKGASGLTNMLVVNQQNASDGSIARFQKNANDVLKVEYSGNTNLMNNKILQLATPTASTDGANKKYVDQSVGAPSQYSWKREKRSSSPSQGYFCVKSGTFLYLSTHTNNGHRLRYDSGLSTSAKQWPGTGYISTQYLLNGMINIWKRTSAGAADWTLMQIMGAYKYRLGFNGFVELEFKDASGNWENLAYEEEYWINVNGLF